MADSYRRSVKIFIGGLSFETTDEALKRYFEQFGPVADAIVMKDAVSRRSRGFGFITYMNAASVDAALSVEQHIVDNRRVEAKRAVPRSEVPKMDPALTASPLLQPTQSAWDPGFGIEGGYVLRGVPEQRTRSNSTVSAGSMGGMAGLDSVSNACKIFVGGLHYETRDSSLQAYFEQFGPVANAEVMFNRETHKSRGFGFVVFENEESANAVLQSSHHTVNGKVVEVKRAVPRSQSSTGGSNPSSPALMGYPPSPGALGPAGGGGGGLGKPGGVPPKRAQRPRPVRDALVATNAGAGHIPPPGASPQQQRYPSMTSYAAVLRGGSGRQQQAGMTAPGAGKPPHPHPQQYGHTYSQARDDMTTFRFPQSSYLSSSAAARADVAAAQAFVHDLKAWDSENTGEAVNFDESFDCYSEQRYGEQRYGEQRYGEQQRMAPRGYGALEDMGRGEADYSTVLQSSNSWPGPGPGPGSGSTSKSWTQAGQGVSGGQSTLRSSSARMLVHSTKVEDVSPRHGDHLATFHRPVETMFGHEGADHLSHPHLYPSSVTPTMTPNGSDYHNGHVQKTMADPQNGGGAGGTGGGGRLLSPGEGGGTPALMGSSPLLGGGGLLETAFAELSLDGNSVGLSTSLRDGAPNGDGPSLLSGLGGGPPSAASEALPYGRAGGETAVDGGGGSDGLSGSSSTWRADAFGSALGVNVSSTADEIEGLGHGLGLGGRRGFNEGKDISGSGLSDHFLSVLGPAGTERSSSSSQLRLR